MPRTDPALYPDAPHAAVDAVRLGLPLRTSAWSAWDALWAVLGWFVLSNVVAVAVLVAGIDIYGPAFLLVTIVPWIALAGWPLWITRRRGNGVEIDLGLRLRWYDIWTGAVGGVAAFGVGLLTSAITVALFGDFSSAAGDEAQNVADSGGAVVLIIFAVLVVVGAPLAEELAFRGLLWSGLAKRGASTWVSILVTSAAFAAIHFEPVRLLVLFSIGAVLGVVRWRTGSLGACVVAHAVNNLPPALGLLWLLHS